MRDESDQRKLRDNPESIQRISLMIYCKINVLYPKQKTLKENKRESGIKLTLTDKKLLLPEGMEFKSIEYDEDTDFEFDDTCFFRVRTKVERCTK